MKSTAHSLAGDPLGIPPGVEGRVSEWRDIASAPKDGSTILITALDEDGAPFEIHAMQWAHLQRNGLFPGVLGMWITPCGSCTWNDDGHGNGPTHWAPTA